MGSTEQAPSLSIGYVSPGWPAEAYPNGVATAIGTLTPAFRAMGHRVTIVATQVIGKTRHESVYDLAHFRVPRTLAHSVLVRLGHRIAPQSTHNHDVRRALLRAIRRAQAERNIDVLEIEDAFGWAEWVRQNTSVPICLRLHGPWFLNGTAQGCAQDRAFHRRVLAEGRAIRAAHAITAPSRDVLERVRQFYGLALPDAHVIPGTTPAVPTDQRWRLENCDRKVVLFVGKFNRHKGGDLMIEAFGRVLREIPDAHLWFVGTDHGYIADDGRMWKIKDFINHRLPGALETGQVQWLGFQALAQLNQLRQRAMVTVVCSRYETFSSATLEALTMGCPTVAARVGGICEIVQDQVDGLLHRPEDPDDLAAKILTLLKDPTRATLLSQQAADTCERRFHPNVVAGRFIDFYRQMIQHCEA
jgi:glycosyltransferase involved in cell wall biosynthesis